MFERIKNWLTRHDSEVDKLAQEHLLAVEMYLERPRTGQITALKATEDRIKNYAFVPMTVKEQKAGIIMGHNKVDSHDSGSSN